MGLHTNWEERSDDFSELISIIIMCYLQFITKIKLKQIL